MPQFTFKKDGQDITDVLLTPVNFVNGVYVTDEQTINNLTTISVDVEYENITPDGADQPTDYVLHASLQGKAENGKWYNIVSQIGGHFSSENAPLRRLIASENPSDYDPDSQHLISDGLGRESVSISSNQANLPDTVRICIELLDRATDPPRAGLNSVQLSISGIFS